MQDSKAGQPARFAPFASTTPARWNSAARVSFIRDRDFRVVVLWSVLGLVLAAIFLRLGGGAAATDGPFNLIAGMMG